MDVTVHFNDVEFVYICTVFYIVLCLVCSKHDSSWIYVLLYVLSFVVGKFWNGVHTAQDDCILRVGCSWLSSFVATVGEK